jgi:hypothetical protein
MNEYCLCRNSEPPPKDQKASNNVSSQGIPSSSSSTFLFSTPRAISSQHSGPLVNLSGPSTDRGSLSEKGGKSVMSDVTEKVQIFEIHIL